MITSERLYEMTSELFEGMGFSEEPDDMNLDDDGIPEALYVYGGGTCEVPECVAQLIALEFEIDKIETRIKECLIIAGSEDGKILGLCGRLVAGDKSRIFAQIKAHEQYLARLKAKREELWKR